MSIASVVGEWSLRLVRVLLPCLVIASLAAPARADGAAIRAAVERELLRGDEAAAVRVLEELAAREPPVPDELLAGASAARELIGGPVGDAQATTLLLTALEHEPGHRPSWDAAQALREDLMSALRYETGSRLIEGLARIYPDVPHYRHHLATLRMDCGHAAAARELLLALLRDAPSNTAVLYDLATIEEGLGLYEQAIARFERIIEISGDLEAHRLRTTLLWHKLRDFEAARGALETGLAATRDAPPGRNREYYLEKFEQERGQLQKAIERREGLLAFDARLDRLIAGLAVGWALVLGTGIGWLRRRRIV